MKGVWEKLTDFERARLGEVMILAGRTLEATPDEITAALSHADLNLLRSALRVGIQSGAATEPTKDAVLDLVREQQAAHNDDHGVLDAIRRVLAGERHVNDNIKTALAMAFAFSLLILFGWGGTFGFGGLLYFGGGWWAGSSGSLCAGAALMVAALAVLPAAEQAFSTVYPFIVRVVNIIRPTKLLPHQVVQGWFVGLAWEGAAFVLLFLVLMLGAIELGFGEGIRKGIGAFSILALFVRVAFPGSWVAIDHHEFWRRIRYGIVVSVAGILFMVVVTVLYGARKVPDLMDRAVTMVDDYRAGLQVELDRAHQRSSELEDSLAIEKKRASTSTSDLSAQLDAVETLYHESQQQLWERDASIEALQTEHHVLEQRLQAAILEANDKDTQLEVGEIRSADQQREIDELRTKRDAVAADLLLARKRLDAVAQWTSVVSDAVDHECEHAKRDYVACAKKVRDTMSTFREDALVCIIDGFGPPMYQPSDSKIPDRHRASDAVFTWGSLKPCDRTLKDSISDE